MLSTLAMLIAVATGLRLSGGAGPGGVHAGGPVYVVNDPGDRGLSEGARCPAEDAGDRCTLRAAIEAANQEVLRTTINFSIGSSLQTIAPLKSLPEITQPVVIDGTTQPTLPGRRGLPAIELSGRRAGPLASGLSVDHDSIVRGLVINRWDGAGIVLTSDRNTIAGNFVGTDLTGSFSRGNGIGIRVFSNGNTVGGTAFAEDRNVISGNEREGILIQGGRLNEILGNFIGTDAEGKRSLANLTGVRLQGAPQNFIGSGSGLGFIGRNIISGNLGDGLVIEGDLSFVGQPASFVRGNFIGTDTSGRAGLGNGESGVRVTVSDTRVVGAPQKLLRGGLANVISGNVISGNSGYGIAIVGSDEVKVGGVQVLGNLVGTDRAGDTALANLLGGVFVSDSYRNTIGPGNVISGNGGTGLRIEDSPDFLFAGRDHLVVGNRIGTNAASDKPIGNVGDGILLENTFGVRIGGRRPSDRNVISGNVTSGIVIFGAGGRDNSVSGNFIGTNSRGKDLGNGVGFGPSGERCTAICDGVTIAGGASENVLESNVIAFNRFAGVSILAGRGNRISRNAIFENGGLGIDLVSRRVLPLNDPLDKDDGPNRQQNYPQLTDAPLGGTSLTGVLKSTPNTRFQIQLFRSKRCDPSGSGEGQELVGFTRGTTAERGVLDFRINVAKIQGGQVFTAIAIDEGTGDTSEFSRCLRAG